jgi:muramidase (phage lysozyme)
VSAAGPFSGVIAKMFSPLLGGLATVFGLNQGAFAAELNSAAMTEKQGANALSKFFASFFKLFGFTIDGEDGEDAEEDDNNQTTATGDWAPLLDTISAGEGGYTSVNPGQKIDDLTNMTIADAWEAAKNLGHSKGGTGAMGRYQLLSDPVGRARAAGLDPSKDKFSPANQDKIASHIIENVRRGKDWREGKINDEQFGQLIANEWAGVQGPNGRGAYDGDGQNSAKVKWSKVKEALNKVKGKPATGAAKGTSQPITNTFTNNVQGVFEMTGPDTGYRIPPQYTGGQPVIGHGLEWLIKLSNKFVILPGVNKEYNIYTDPEKAFDRWDQIEQQGGPKIAGLVNWFDNTFGPKPTGKTPVYGEGFKPKRVYRAEDESGAEILRLLGGTQIKGASLPQGQVKPIAVPKDTVTGTTGTAVIAMMQPVIQYVPVTVPGPTKIEYVEANPFVAAKKGNEMIYLQGLS